MTRLRLEGWDIARLRLEEWLDQESQRGCSMRIEIDDAAYEVKQKDISCYDSGFVRIRLPGERGIWLTLDSEVVAQIVGQVLDAFN